MSWRAVPSNPWAAKRRVAAAIVSARTSVSEDRDATIWEAGPYHVVRRHATAGATRRGENWNREGRRKGVFGVVRRVDAIRPDQRPSTNPKTPPLLPVAVVPLRLGGGEARGVPLGALVLEEELPRWKDRQALVAEDPEVELAPVHVLLDERVALEAIVEEAGPVEGFLFVLRERR